MRITMMCSEASLIFAGCDAPVNRELIIRFEKKIQATPARV